MFSVPIPWVGCNVCPNEPYKHRNKENGSCLSLLNTEFQIPSGILLNHYVKLRNVTFVPFT
jgi:hypothetical protein